MNGKYEELVLAVRTWLAVDEYVAEHGYDSTVEYDGEMRRADEAWDDARRKMVELVNGGGEE